jgi:hypothetical protein
MFIYPNVWMKCIISRQKITVYFFNSVLSFFSVSNRIKKVYGNFLPRDYTFHPDIGINKHRPGQDSTQEEFIERMTNSYKITEANLQQVRKDNDNYNVDNKTGQELFHPKINKSKTDTRNVGDIATHEFLYARRVNKQEKIEILQREEEQRLIEKANKIKKASKTDH